MRCWCGNLSDRLDQGRQGVGVVPVIDDHRRPVDIQHVEAAGDLVHVGGEGFGPGADHVRRHLQGQGRGHGGQGVFHVEGDLAAAASSGTRSSDENDFFAIAFGQRRSWLSRTKMACPPALRCRTITGWLPSRAK